jgi:hypothetical protein
MNIGESDGSTTRCAIVSSVEPSAAKFGLTAAFGV